jgi:hypothetical protein
MEEIKIELAELVDPPKTDSISGRKFGQDYAVKKSILENIENGKKIILMIDDSKIKAINDSFLKGFFSKIFEAYKSKEKVESVFEIKANEYYKKLIDKNLKILEAIYK